MSLLGYVYLSNTKCSVVLQLDRVSRFHARLSLNLSWSSAQFILDDVVVTRPSPSYLHTATSIITTAKSDICRSAGPSSQDGLLHVFPNFYKYLNHV